MKGLVLGLLVLLGLDGLAQSVGYLRYDSTIIMKQGGYNELVIRNRTKDTTGFLFNTGNGVTQFRRVRQLNDTTFVMGVDTVLIKSSASGASARIVTLNGLGGANQLLATGTAGLAPAWNSVGSTHTLNIPSALTAGVTNGTVPYTRTQIWDAKIGPGDTATMLANYLSGGDTLSLSNRINAIKASGLTALIGDVVTSGTSPEGVAISNLVPTGVIPGTYTNANITVDEKGRILVASSGSGGGGGGTDNVNGGLGYRLVTSGQVIRSLIPGNGILLDSATTGSLTFKADTSILATLNDLNSISGGIGALTGDVVASGTGSVGATIANDAVTYAKIQNVTTQRILGRYTAGAGDMQEISLGSGLSLTGGVLDVVSSGSSYTFSAPLSETGGLVSIANAAADGTTKGASAFTASDFNSSAGVISLDVTNGPTASAGAKGYLTAADWTTFNNKQNALGFTPENVANKSTSTTLGTSNVAYPSQNAVKVYVDDGLALKQDLLGYTPENVASKSTNTALGVSNILYPSQNAVKVYVDNGLATKQNTLSLTTTGSGAASLIGDVLNIPIPSGSTYTAGTRLTLVGNQFNVDTLNLLAPYQTAINQRLQNITGLITPGTNVTITGSGTSGSPYVINATGASGFVPYTGATTNLNLGTHSLLTQSTVFSPITGSYAAGALFYDNEFKSLSFYNDEADVSLQVGQESWIRVRNETGATIANGAAVYINGTHASGTPTIALARADDPSTVVVAGLATHSIENGTIGYITTIGEVRGLNTNSFTAGQSIYLSPTVAGGLTQTAPASPNYRFRVGVVTKSNPSTGSINVTPSTGALGNGTANQMFGMNAAGTRQEVKTLQGTTNRISVTNAPGSMTFDIASNYAGQSSINTVGTITSGTWQGSSIGDGYISSAATWNNKISNITGLVSAGTNVTITGTGAAGNPYVINGSAGATYTAGTRLTLVGNQFNVDSSGLLAPYQTALNARVRYTDTATMLAPYAAKINTKLENITGKIIAGTNVTITGAGTTASPYEINASPGGGGSGTVNSGLANRLAYYTASGTVVDDLAAITANRLVVSDANGLPTHSTATSTEAGYLAGVTSGIQTQLNGKEATLPVGTSAQYFRGDKTLGTFPTDLSSFANGPGYLTNITGKVTAGANISITGAGTTASPYVIAGAAGGTTYTGTTNRVTVSGGTIDIADTYTGQASITTLGTIGTGVWNGTAIGTAYGGVPTGGAAGQVLTKTNSSNYNMVWSDVPAGSKWTQGTGIISYTAGNVGIGTTVNSGDKLRVVGSVRFDLGSDATGDLPYRTSTGSLGRLAAPSGLTSPMLSYASGAPVWVEAPTTGGGSGVTINNNTNNNILTASGSAGIINGETAWQLNGVAFTGTGVAPYFTLTNTDNSDQIRFGFVNTGVVNEPILGIYTAGVTNGRVVQRQPTTNNVYIGDIDNNGGALVLRAAGTDKARLTTAGMMLSGMSTGTNTDSVVVVNGGLLKMVAQSTLGGGGGGTPAGSTGYIQYNNAGAFGAENNLFWDATNNRLGIGTTTPLHGFSINNINSGQGSTIELMDNSASARPNIHFRRSRGAAGAATAVQANDLTGTFRFEAHDGTNYILNAFMAVESVGTIATNSVPGQFRFTTGVNGSGLVDRLTINNSGVTINASTNSYTLASTRGTNGQVLTSNGAGGTSWTTVSGGGGSQTLQQTLDLGNTSTTSLAITGVKTTGAHATFGGLSIQGLAASHSLIANNLYYNGGWRPIATGTGSAISLQDNQIGFGHTASTTAGTVVAQTNYMIMGPTGISFHGNQYVIPATIGTAGQVLTVPGSGNQLIWSTPSSGGGSGTVTGGSGGTTGLTLTGSTTLTLGGTLAVGHGGTGTSTPSLVAGSGINITGTWPNQTISATSTPTYALAMIDDMDYTVSALITHVRFNAMLTADRTLTLPSAAANAGRVIKVFLRNRGTVGQLLFNTVSGGIIMFDTGTTTLPIPTNISGQTFEFFSDGTNWIMVGLGRQ